ncbi:hypothetical protein PBI_LUCKY2013_54 [Mycobacterium phage Lucky2013]|uniref:Uncharacterized protein n=1 Tax=Mycobacterium phage Superphikiman TaxID=2041551 RepID=A0A2D2W3X2_9CAUD|nr:hypothetical protein PBI_LUCKY2013_54 [Mycobacterium phage Lucky2013]ASZ74129.1 hypothetical protein SEA_SQUINT_53 [Mycobacterium phage Squint]ATS92897.1 hypothetical protein SEA_SUPERPHIKIMAN_54 [Mycobacterium phage Superphikiman]
MTYEYGPFCSHCGDTTVAICNGCYGWLNANGESQA